MRSSIGTACGSTAPGTAEILSRMALPPPPPAAECPSRGVPRAARWMLAGLGFVSLGLGILGIWVPGLPTTVFLITASWLFTRSCPPLDRWMRTLGPVQPFVRFLDGAPIPAGVTLWILLLMWGVGGWSAFVVADGWVRVAIAGALGVGSVVVVRRSAWRAPRGPRPL